MTRKTRTRVTHDGDHPRRPRDRGEEEKRPGTCSCLRKDWIPLASERRGTSRSRSCHLPIRDCETDNLARRGSTFDSEFSLFFLFRLSSVRSDFDCSVRAETSALVKAHDRFCGGKVIIVYAENSPRRQKRAECRNGCRDVSFLIAAIPVIFPRVIVVIITGAAESRPTTATNRISLRDVGRARERDYVHASATRGSSACS